MPGKRGEKTLQGRQSNAESGLTAAERRLHRALNDGARLRPSYGGRTYFVSTHTDKDGIRRGFTVRAETYESYRRKMTEFLPRTQRGADHAQ